MGSRVKRREVASNTSGSGGRCCGWWRTSGRYQACLVRNTARPGVPVRGLPWARPGAWPGVPVRVLPGARPGAPAMRRSRACSAFWAWETTWATWCRRQLGFCPGHGGQQRVSGHSEQRTSAIGQQGGVHIGRVCLWSTFTHGTCQTTHGTHHKAQVSEMTAHVAHVRLHTWGTCRLQMWHMLFPSRSVLPADAI